MVEKANRTTARVSTQGNQLMAVLKAAAVRGAPLPSAMNSAHSG